MSDYAILQKRSDNNRMQQFVTTMMMKAAYLKNAEMENIMRVELSVLMAQERELKKEEVELRGQVFRKGA